jgi:hypothetical protein
MKPARPSIPGGQRVKDRRVMRALVTAVVIAAIALGSLLLIVP